MRDGMTEQESYSANGYALLCKLFPVPVVSAFYNRLQFDLDLQQSARSFLVEGPLLSKAAVEVYSHQYAPMATFLWAVTPVASRVAECELLPTYAYFRIYQQGDICRVHSDRHACEHSLSIALALSDERAWALSIGRQQREGPTTEVAPDFGSEEFASLPMSAGDAVMYKGVAHRHGRLEPNPNRWSAHLFLHWVDANGPHREHAFDRPTLERYGLAGT